MGCSNPHPHGQVWSLSEVPSYPASELFHLREYSLNPPPALERRAECAGPNGRPCMLCDYAQYELTVPSDEGRIVLKNEHWLALVPYWAVWPFEILREFPVLTWVFISPCL
jgi:UDPglucose--hexose-1-phosphate uridylyltransferase